MCSSIVGAQSKMYIEFFTWLNDPNTERNYRPRPKIMENIPQFKQKEVSIYKPTDLGAEEDAALSQVQSH